MGTGKKAVRMVGCLVRCEEREHSQRSTRDLLKTNSVLAAERPDGVALGGHTHEVALEAVPAAHEVGGRTVSGSGAAEDSEREGCGRMVAAPRTQEKNS